MMNETDPSMLPVLLEHLRLLKWHERVRRGDFVANEHHEFELWEGPPGFRADSFVKQIYRRLARRPAQGKKEE
jgi:hypothetical protein